MLIHAVLIVAALGAIRFIRRAWQRESEPVYFEVLDEVLVTPTERPSEPLSEPVSEPVPEPAAEPRRELPPEPAPEPVPEPQPLPELPAVIPVIVETPPPAASPSSPTLPPPMPAREERARVIAPPEATSRIAPNYPRSARRKGWEGTTEVEAAIGANGLVNEAIVVKSSGHRELDEAALRAVRAASFRPATEDGRAIAFRLRIPISFRLSSLNGR